MSDADKGLYNKYLIINRETGEEADGSFFVLNPVKDHAAREALEEYARVTSNDYLRADLMAWLETMPDFQRCDWCGEGRGTVMSKHRESDERKKISHIMTRKTNQTSKPFIFGIPELIRRIKENRKYQR